MPLVSIITPVYNAAEWLPEMFASVAGQTFTDWEHILVDDGSSDDSIPIILRAADGDSRIQLLRMPANGGPARARNRAIAAARGRYLAFLDADDLWLPGKLERMINFIEQSGCSFAYHAFRYLSADGLNAGALVMGPARLNLKALHTRRGTGDCMSMVIDRAKVTNFGFSENPDATHEDWLAWLSLVNGGHEGRLLPEDLGRYRLSGKSRNAKKLSAAQAVWRLYRTGEGLPWPRAASWWLQYAWNSFRLHSRSRPRENSRRRNLPPLDVEPVNRNTH